VLYVDDEAINLRLMRDVFRMVLRRPDSVFTAASGQEALKMLESESYDVVISDQRMPGMLGTQLLERVRRVAPKAVRLLVTGYPGDVEIRNALESGAADAILTKPWKPKELETLIKNLVAERRA
jgi:serine/threonine-protein kinase